MWIMYKYRYEIAMMSLTGVNFAESDKMNHQGALRGYLQSVYMVNISYEMHNMHTFQNVD